MDTDLPKLFPELWYEIDYIDCVMWYEQIEHKQPTSRFTKTQKERRKHIINLRNQKKVDGRININNAYKIRYISRKKFADLRNRHGGKFTKKELH